jgi:hypothetical protein
MFDDTHGGMAGRTFWDTLHRSPVAAVMSAARHDAHVSLALGRAGDCPTECVTGRDLRVRG